MEETKEQQGLYKFLQFGIYLSVSIDILIFVFGQKLINDPRSLQYGLSLIIERISRIIIYHQPLNSKLFTLILVCLVSVGTLSRKKKDLNPKNEIAYPLSIGLIVFFFSIWFYNKEGKLILPHTDWYDLGYALCTLLGTILIHVAMDNVSKIIHSNLGKDKWNIEGESFMQPVKAKATPYAVNIPMLFYFKGKVRKGFIPLQNMFRGTILSGVPGSGKSFSIIMPIIRQMIAKQFTMCIYDIKFPDLGRVAYYHYLLAKQNGKCKDFKFHVINLNEPEKSRRINPWKSFYSDTLADASETAEGTVEALKKADKSSGSDQFFTQSAVNFLAACIYFFSKHEDGSFSSFPHVMAFLNCSYEDIFNTLFSNRELSSLLSPFVTAFKAKAYDQLEGQIGTLKIFISRMATKETFWVLSGDDFELKVSSPEQPSILILANDPKTQSINSACYSVVLNRITKLVNSKGNLPVGLIIDEAPSLYIYKAEVLLAQARSNLVALLLGIQSVQQLQQQYGKETAATLTSVVGNVLSGSVQNKETLEWLERIFGKVKQQSESLSIDRTKTSLSISEKLEPLIPAGKIAALKAGEIVGLLATDAVEKFTGQFESTAINCRVNLDLSAIKKEEDSYRELPIFYDFKGKKEEILLQNFYRITAEVEMVISKFRPNPIAPQTKLTKATLRGEVQKSN